MFTDEKTQQTIYADLNDSVIHGTHRNCDLIPAFLDVIKDTTEYSQIVVDNRMPSVVTDPCADERDERWEDEGTTEFCIDLFDVLDSFSPDGYYFGAHPGDGSDFGYWKSEDFD